MFTNWIFLLSPCVSLSKDEEPHWAVQYYSLPLQLTLTACPVTSRESPYTLNNYLRYFRLAPCFSDNTWRRLFLLGQYFIEYMSKIQTAGYQSVSWLWTLFQYFGIKPQVMLSPQLFQRLLIALYSVSWSSPCKRNGDMGKIMAETDCIF